MSALDVRSFTVGPVQENCYIVSAAGAAKRNSKRAPRPWRLCTWMVPPSCPHICRTADNPPPAEHKRIFGIIPNLSFLAIVGLYSLYLYYTGLPVLMKVPLPASRIAGAKTGMALMAPSTSTA